jgi:hypothetical protein
VTPKQYEVRFQHIVKQKKYPDNQIFVKKTKPKINGELQNESFVVRIP